MQVLERSFKRHQNGMEEAIQVAGDDVREQMRAVAHWLMSQPPVNIARMGESDFHAISPANAARLSQLIFDSLRLPLTEALERSQQAGIVNLDNPGLAAITFVSMVEMIHGDNAPYMTGMKGQIIDQLIDMQLYGWLKR